MASAAHPGVVEVRRHTDPTFDIVVGDNFRPHIAGDDVVDLFANMFERTETKAAAAINAALGG